MLATEPTQLQTPSLAERLEQGELVTWPVCPFPLPPDADRDFLRQQQLRGPAHKHIYLDPQSDKLVGFVRTTADQEDRLRRLLTEFGEQATAWLRQTLPRYVPGLTRDRVNLSTEEEATRRLRQSARNDLLHIDAFPSRPTQGARILRLFVNLNPTDPRIWATSDTFRKLWEQFGRQIRVPLLPTGWPWRLSQQVLGLFQPGRAERSVYDQMMLVFHHFLKNHTPFQDRHPRRLWHFPPLAAWLLFTDGLSYAELRGQYVLEHSFFVAPHSLVLPTEAPYYVLNMHRQQEVTPHAA